MYLENITMEKALELESQGIVEIVDASPKFLKPWKGNSHWKDAYTRLQTKVFHVSPEKVLSHFNTKYRMEVFEIENEETGTCVWRYFYAIEIDKKFESISEDTEYVYVLTNPGYPDLVKIGMTVRDVQKRAESINATGTVSEWVAKFAIPLQKGSAYKVEQNVHKHFSYCRVDSDQGSSREFFRINPMIAFDKVRELGKDFLVGDPIVY